MLAIHPSSFCGVCWEEYSTATTVTPHSIPCGHVYCSNCLGQITNCPECRVEYAQRDVRRLWVDYYDDQASITSELRSMRAVQKVLQLYQSKRPQPEIDSAVEQAEQWLRRQPATRRMGLRQTLEGIQNCFGDSREAQEYRQQADELGAHVRELTNQKKNDEEVWKAVEQSLLSQSETLAAENRALAAENEHLKWQHLKNERRVSPPNHLQIVRPRIDTPEPPDSERNKHASTSQAPRLLTAREQPESSTTRARAVQANGALSLYRHSLPAKAPAEDDRRTADLPFAPNRLVADLAGGSIVRHASDEGYGSSESIEDIRPLPPPDQVTYPIRPRRDSDHIPSPLVRAAMRLGQNVTTPPVVRWEDLAHSDGEDTPRDDARAGLGLIGVPEARADHTFRDPTSPVDPRRARLIRRYSTPNPYRGESSPHAQVPAQAGGQGPRVVSDPANVRLPGFFLEGLPSVATPAPEDLSPTEERITYREEPRIRQRRSEREHRPTIPSPIDDLTLSAPQVRIRLPDSDSDDPGAQSDQGPYVTLTSIGWDPEPAPAPNARQRTANHEPVRRREPEPVRQREPEPVVEGRPRNVNPEPQTPHRRDRDAERDTSRPASSRHRSYTASAWPSQEQEHSSRRPPAHQPAAGPSSHPHPNADPYAAQRAAYAAGMYSMGVPPQQQQWPPVQDGRQTYHRAPASQPLPQAALQPRGAYFPGAYVPLPLPRPANASRRSGW